MSNRNITFVRNQLKNYHASQKWMWTVLMVFSLFQSTRIMAGKVGEYLQGDPPELFGFTAIFYVLFLITVYRFYVGDNRIVDLYYDTLPETFSDDLGDFQTYMGTLKPHVLVLDGIVRVGQYVLFVAAATNLHDLRLFVGIMAFLLLVNAIFSLFIKRVVRGLGTTVTDLMKDLGESDSLTELSFSTPRIIWIANNLATSAVILVSVACGLETALLIAMVALFINSLVDIWACRAVYAPDFRAYLPD